MRLSYHLTRTFARTKPLLMVLPVTLLAISFARIGSAQDLKPAPPQDTLINDIAASHPISAYVEESTLLVAKIAWDKLDADAFFALVQDLTGDRPSDLPKVKRAQQILSDADAGSIFLLGGFQTALERNPPDYIPTPKPKQLVESFEDMLGAPRGSATVRIDQQGVLIGAQALLDRFDDHTPVNRDQLLAPLRDANNLDHTVVLILPDEMRSLLGGIWPGGPQDALPIRLSPNDLVAGISRVVITVRTPPRPLVRVIVDTADEKTADQLATQFAGLKSTFGNYLADVTIKRDDGRITLEADEQAFGKSRSLAMVARENSRQTDLVRTMRQLGLAVHQYHGNENHFPPRCFVDPEGNRLHSWMVAVLPYFEQQALYRSLRLDLAWDAPENDRIKITSPAGVGHASLPVAHTTIRAPYFPGSMWHGDGAPKTIKDIVDGTSNTIMLADAPKDASVHWADPSPWVISETDPMKDFFGDRDHVRVLMADGAVLMLDRKKMDNDKLKAMLTIAGSD